MKKIFFFLFLISIFNIFSVTRHIIKNNHVNANNNHNDKDHPCNKKYPSILELNAAKNNIICYQGIEVDTTFLYFINIYPLYCIDFFMYVFNTYAKNDKKNDLISQFYDQSPEQLWDILNNEANFSCQFIEMINIIYEKNNFILMCKVRMMIEFLIFAFNIKEKSIEYQYSYFKEIDLKKILVVLLDFVNYQAFLLEEQITVNQVNDFKKFLYKYIQLKSINRLQFISELKKFKYFITIFFEDKASHKSPSAFEQMEMLSRFFKIVKA